MLLKGKSYQGDSFKDGYAIVKINRKYGVLSTKGKWIFQPLYYKIRKMAKSSFLKIATKKHDKIVYALANWKERRILSDFIYANIKDFSEGLVQVKISKKNKNKQLYGYIDTKGNEIIECQYTHSTPFLSGYALVYTKKGGATIDMSGQTYKVSKYKEIQKEITQNKEDSLRVKQVELADLNSGKPHLVIEEGAFHFYYYNKYTKSKKSIAFDSAFQFHGETSFVKEGEKWGLKSYSRGKKTKKIYEGHAKYEKKNAEILSQKRNSRKIYKWKKLHEGEWHMVNSNLENITYGAKYSKVRPASNGVSIALVESRYGILNKDGKQILENKYESVDHMGNGIFKVSTADSWGYINYKGEWIYKPTNW